MKTTLPNNSCIQEVKAITNKHCLLNSDYECFISTPMGCSQTREVRGQRSHTTAYDGYDDSDVDREIFITLTLCLRQVTWDTENQTRHQAT